MNSPYNTYVFDMNDNKNKELIENLTKNKNEMPSEIVEAKAAPLMPMAGRPAWPKMRIQSSRILLATNTMEFQVRQAVFQVPT